MDETDLNAPQSLDILEEILELSRSNQKLIRNPEGALGSNLEEMRSLLRELFERTERYGETVTGRSRRLHPAMFEEILHLLPDDSHTFVGLQLVLAMVRSDLPWIYDAGIETINIIRSERPVEDKHEAFAQFDRLVDISFEHPLMRELHGRNKEYRMLYRELSHTLRRSMQRALNGR